MRKIADSTGFSILEVIVSLAIIGLVLPLSIKSLLETNKNSLRATQQMDLTSLARSVMNQVDCSSRPTSCVDGSLLTLLQKNGTVLMSSSGNTLLGGWSVRALCTNNNQFNVQVAKISSNGEFVKDPVSGQLLNWNHPKAKIFNDKILCPSQGTMASQDVSMIRIVSGLSCTVLDLSQLPCNPPEPPPCPAGYASAGLSKDVWGGTNYLVAQPTIFGQLWIRYCAKY